MTDDVLAMAMADSARPKVATEEAIGIIGMLAQKQVDLEKEVKDLEERVKEKKFELKRLQEETLPEAMDVVGMKKFELKSGFKIEVKPYYGASISEENREDAYEWLERNNHDDIIKSKVIVEFGKGELEIANEFMAFIRGWNTKKIEPEFTRTVHPMTLKSFVKGEVENGTTLPDSFTVFIGRQAKVTRS